jgi:uncharacterized membrane protein YgcG
VSSSHTVEGDSLDSTPIRKREMSYTSVFFVGLALSLVLTFVIAAVDNWSSVAACLTLIILLTGTFLTATCVSRLLADRIPRAVGAALVAVAYLGVAAFVGWVGHANSSGQRCVNTATMTVESSSLCQGTTMNGGGVYAWYYGGEGTDEGDTVTGGSFTAPENGDEGGTGGGGGVDSGGGDEGGGEGGGEG